MPLEVRHGDLFEARGLAALAHGCNCSGSMGRGIAVQFRKRWPAMYALYRRRCIEGEFRPGDVFVWNAGDKVIFNLATQLRPGPYAKLEHIAAAVTSATRIAEASGIQLIGMPRIGTGYGGLAWSAVWQVLEAIGTQTPVVLAVYELASDV